MLEVRIGRVRCPCAADVENGLERWVLSSLYVSGVVMGRVVKMLTEFEFSCRPMRYSVGGPNSELVVSGVHVLWMLRRNSSVGSL